MASYSHISERLQTLGGSSTLYYYISHFLCVEIWPIKIGYTNSFTYKNYKWHDMKAKYIKLSLSNQVFQTIVTIKRNDWTVPVYVANSLCISQSFVQPYSLTLHPSNSSTFNLRAASHQWHMHPQWRPHVPYYHHLACSPCRNPSSSKLVDVIWETGFLHSSTQNPSTESSSAPHTKLDT